MFIGAAVHFWTSGNAYKEASIQLNISTNSIRNILRDKTYQIKGYKFFEEKKSNIVKQYVEIDYSKCKIGFKINLTTGNKESIFENPRSVSDIFNINKEYIASVFNKNKGVLIKDNYKYFYPSITNSSSFNNIRVEVLDFNTKESLGKFDSLKSISNNFKIGLGAIQYAFKKHNYPTIINIPKYNITIKRL